MDGLTGAGLLLAAGFLAGAMNAVAGGGTFVSPPAPALMGMRRLPTAVLRALILTIAVATTTAFFVHAYLP